LSHLSRHVSHFFAPCRALTSSCRAVRRGLPRFLLCLRGGLSGLVLLFGLSASAHAFNFDDIALRAKRLAAAPYAPPAKNLSGAIAGLDYDQYRDIRFDPAKSTWRDQKLPFELAFFHQGRTFDTPVHVFEINGKVVREIKFQLRRQYPDQE
jgi:glucan biosynthesis protein